MTCQRPNTERKAEVSRLGDQIIFYVIEGPAHLHQLLEISERQMPFIDAIMTKHKRWGGLMVFHNSCIMSEDCLGAAPREMQHLKESGKTAYCAAYVIPPDIDGYNMMETIYAKYHVDTGVIFKVFECAENARAWLEETLASADENKLPLEK